MSKMYNREAELRQANIESILKLWKRNKRVSQVVRTQDEGRSNNTRTKPKRIQCDLYPPFDIDFFFFSSHWILYFLL